MDGMKLTLLSKEEILREYGNKQIDAIKKYGPRSAITDLAIITGGTYDATGNYSVSDDDGLKGRTCLYYTRSSNEYGYCYYIYISSIGTYNDSYKRDGVIRPVLSSKFFSQITSIRTKGYNGVDIVKFGEYPQYAPGYYIQEELEKAYQNKTLQETGKTYIFDSTKYDDYKTDFSPVMYEEYEYAGGKYIRVMVRPSSNIVKLSNGLEYTEKDFVWIEVLPVEWLVDDKAKLLISKKGLVSGIRFQPYEKKYYGLFTDTEMKKYLDQYMLPDLLQNVKIIQNEVDSTDKELNEKSQEVNVIISEIYRLISDYDVKNDISKKVKTLINEYNNNLVNNSNTGGLTLSNGPTDKKGLYLKLVDDLKSILDKIKSNKEYFLMLDLIKKCTDILNGKKTKNVLDDLIDDIKTISDVILPFLKDESKNKEIMDIFNREKENIIDYLMGNENNTIKECKTVDDFKLRIRSELHVFLTHISEDVRSKDLIDEIKEGYFKISTGIFEKERDDYINNLLLEINKLVDEIKIRGNNKEQETIEKLFNEEIFDDYTDLTSLINKLKKMYILLYGMILDINERENEQKELEDYTITMSGKSNM